MQIVACIRGNGGFLVPSQILNRGVPAQIVTPTVFSSTDPSRVVVDADTGRYDCPLNPDSPGGPTGVLVHSSTGVLSNDNTTVVPFQQTAEVNVLPLPDLFTADDGSGNDLQIHADPA